MPYVGGNKHKSFSCVVNQKAKDLPGTPPPKDRGDDEERDNQPWCQPSLPVGHCGKRVFNDARHFIHIAVRVDVEQWSALQASRKGQVRLARRHK